MSKIDSIAEKIINLKSILLTNKENDYASFIFSDRNLTLKSAVYTCYNQETEKIDKNEPINNLQLVRCTSSMICTKNYNKFIHCYKNDELREKNHNCLFELEDLHDCYNNRFNIFYSKLIDIKENLFV